MGARSSVAQLPDPIREELNRRLVSGGFSDYRGLAGWLSGQGYEISKSAVHTYGQQFERRLAALSVATEQARAIAETAQDDQGAMGDALTRLAQEACFKVLLDLLEKEELPSPSLPALTKAVALLNQTSVLQKRWQREVRERATAAAEKVAEFAQTRGLSEEAVTEIRRRILGIAS